MLNESAEFLEGVVKKMGVPLRIPRPGKTMRTVSAVTNGVVGVGLVTAGVVVSSKVLVGLGVLGLAGTILVSEDL